MEFNQKLQELRKRKNLTQDELAKELYVSRTAISKWEAGRGYPNIDSLKAIAQFFSVSIDELLTSNEVLTIAEEEGKQKEKRFLNLSYGLLDLCISLLLFLPFFAERSDGIIQCVSLFTLSSVQPYLKVAYFIVVFSTIAMGALTLALQGLQSPIWLKSKTAISLIIGSISALLFTISSQPYPAVFAFVLLAIKSFSLIGRQ